MTDIFISYSHKDEAWKDALRQQLQVLQLHTEFAIWDDRQIEVGASWLPAIENAIAQARVAILLVSSDFLASEFVTRQEIPKFLQRREQEGLRIVPVIVRPCAWKTVPWLASLQGAVKDNKPLSAYPLGSFELEEAFSAITEKVHALLMAAKHEDEVKRIEAERVERERLAREAEQRRLEEERARQEAEAKRIAEAKAAQERETQRLAAEQAQREAALKREAELKRQAKINAQELESRQQAINQQRIAILSEKLSKLYLQRDTETRVEEKFRLDALIQETEGELAGLGVSTSHTPPPKKLEVVKADAGGLNKWLLSGVGVVVLASAGWVFINRDKPAPMPSVPAVQSNPAAVEAPAPVVVTKPPTEPIKPERLPFEPEMVTIPAGTFTMGCVPKRDLVEGLKECPSDELPAREVKVDVFQIGKYEVTFDEWDACEQAKVCPHAEDEGWGRGKRPVINVSWDDIQVYLKWLNEKTGKNYRLPTEAEWEYAARGGKNSAYSWGTNKIACTQARYGKWGDECKDSDKTVTIGSYAANGYGLYDTAGNVWEWTASNYSDNYLAAEQKTYRVLRGGSWYYSGWYCRSANRYRSTPDDRDYFVGFRFALGQ
ncbi:MAG: SUMF1/EgtB/PvdO family nonheme iron enzyme [Thiofilum sp.]|uniref:SUMF1/EgtB/PvdO family nonheme iron enzyme n=1 Tax=Thiofilum sp. TaxID=2212733 RepID=UPI0025D965B3|nr:SUMF1/EgtB/PvdO family nonheme iron enzyme [Thiofilum sp.]MBK8452943.1 SUMF1/EgtB/PvdO family nonheme iron enzyme [Thiofilum sp.]